MRGARRAAPLDVVHVDRLPGACGGCLVWELGIAGPDRRAVAVPRGMPREEPPADPVGRKRAWVREVTDAWGPPGAVIEREGDLVAWASFGPATAYARRLPPVPAPDPEAVLLATLWVGPAVRGEGLGRLLLAAALRESLRHDARALEAYGDRRWRERACALPLPWLLAEGFVVAREHPRTPLVRIDLRRVARWTDSLEHALATVLGRAPTPVTAPVRSPAGAGRQGP